jgi:Fur family transcriptional regulator, peroxide stress response regulator
MRQGLTTHRQTVLEVVKESTDHPTARTVFERALIRSPKLSFATVYNALKYLVDQGMIRAVNFGEESMRYDAMLERHDHLICRKCLSVLDVTNIEPPQIGTDFPKPKGFKVEEISFQLIGLCDNCQ